MGNLDRPGYEAASNGHIVLENSSCRVSVAPGLGASLLGFDALREGEWIPVLRPSPPEVSSVLETSMVLMAPWVNRLSGGGFTHDGMRVDLEPNFPGQPLPLHGNALLQPWSVDSVSERQASLSMLSKGPGKFCYSATVEYSLRDDKFSTQLSLRNEGELAMPFGLGFHPWFVRTPATLLQACADQVCLMDERLLPKEWVPVSEHPDWDFHELRKLPLDHVDNPFTGWDGKAMIAWPDLGMSLAVNVSSEVSKHHQVYAPDPGCGFFCLEPVSHAVDEHNLGDSSPNPGLVVLEHGKEMSASMSMRLRFE